ncbi:HsdM family class I SAM-dependent methyltransferase [Haloflavibacter putidus]|uniref:site-specific DNA-methyltransferase (adenine-specific) n=1 Tax=Haloflavibacter putidus TaxID=2576776 RepID=A0A507ZT22_9FLAO|nr:N-6 DNA methylase [Haloflavibacter putidus]TQD39691.1 N-6 DNA methylase [Haloflavibacter putidus]
MNKSILNKYLNNYSNEILAVDRLLVSTFLEYNNIKKVENNLINNYFIKNRDKDYIEFLKFNSKVKIETLEELITAFEYVISPEDKVITGAIYTPENIRNYIVETSFNKWEGNLENITCADIACGCGGFLLTVSNYLKNYTNKNFYEIYNENLFGVDVADYSINRAKILLTLNAILQGEDVDFDFNFHKGNTLCLEINNAFNIPINSFDIIVGNPPYVCSRNMDEESLSLVKNWSVGNSGHPDLYIPFFEVGVENLSPNGVLGYITVNSFFKSINGRALREYISNKKLSLKIVDFGGEQIFEAYNTYTCLCFITNEISDGIHYKRKESKSLFDIKESDFYFIEYENIDDWNGWNLVDNEYAEKLISIIENTGIHFSDKYQTRNGIATLKNKVFKFIPIREDNEFYYRKEKGEEEVRIERGICRSIINSNSIESKESLLANNEVIIFPYYYVNGVRKVISEDEFRTKYPDAYRYLEYNKIVLSERDKGKRDYEAWYAYGRTQSLDIKGFKLFFPHITDSPNFVITKDRDLLFYNGLAAFSEDIDELLILKSILETDIFWFYISQTSKYYVSNHRSISKNYIKKFGIPDFTENEKKIILNHDNKEDVKYFIESKYYERIDKQLKKDQQVNLKNKNSIVI